jgi:hypothetical protein
MMLRVAAAVGPLRLFFLQVRRVREHDLDQAARRRGAVHPSPESLADEERQPPGMVHVRVGHDDGIDGRGIDREVPPVPQAQLLQSLEQAAIEQHGVPARTHQVSRARDRARGAEELNGGWGGSHRRER